jgi:alpha-ketoglutarate-dependent taurine dioxygenase
VVNDAREFGDPDPEISTINSLERKKLYKGAALGKLAALWHSDISFEKAPSDYAALRLTLLPPTGGDTLWASGYEVYDRISKSYRSYLETLTAVHSGDNFHRAAANGGFPLYTKPRGSPLNVGDELSAVHPVVRTNPVTGWKSIYGVGGFTKAVQGLTSRENENLLKYFHDLVTYGHDLQVRFKWAQPNDIGKFSPFSLFFISSSPSLFLTSCVSHLG